MNQIQLAIIVLVAVIVLIIIAYYMYQEHKFKKLLAKNFNQATDDVILDNKGLVFEDQELSAQNTFAHSAKDVAKPTKPLAQKEISFDIETPKTKLDEISAENEQFFAEFDAQTFKFATHVDNQLDHVIDICFAKSIKIKALPEVNQFCTKKSTYYVLDKNNNWELYQKGHKYVANGVKLVIHLVDNEGLISMLQLENIHDALHNFAATNDGYLRHSDSELNIRKIHQQLKNLSAAELELGLYMLNRENLNYRNLAKYFDNNNFINNNGVFEYHVDNRVAFDIRDEAGNPFDSQKTYPRFSINAKLHHQSNPLASIDKIFDFAENYVKYFEARLLTTNKLVLTEKDYDTLKRQVLGYINSLKRQEITPGSNLLLRALP